MQCHQERKQLNTVTWSYELWRSVLLPPPRR